MAATVSTPSVTVLGNKRVSFSTVTFDSSYPTGGESVTPAQLGLSKVHATVCTVKVPEGSYNTASAHYDISNSKFLVYDYDDSPAEVGNTNDISELVINVVAFGV